MNFTNLKTIVRRLLNSRTIGLINIVGLGIGIACTILLVSWILHETSYDRYVPDGDKIYRVTLEGVLNGEFVNSAQSLAGVGPEAVKLFPDVENQARLVNGFKDCVIKMEGKDGFRESGYAADSSFFDIFPYRSIYGDLTKALSKRDFVVVDQYLAKKCFGDEDPMGEAISIAGHKYTVSGVMEDVPSNTHLKFHFLVPFINVDWIQNNQWGGDNSIVFLKLKNNNNIKGLEGEITSLVYERKSFWKDLNIKFRLQNLHDIYFSEFKFDYAEKGNLKHIYIFGITAFLVLLIACINFTNLFIASALKRKRSIGVKLANGANRILILKEFLMEVIMFLAISFLLALVLIKIVQPYFILLAGKEIIIKIFSLKFLTISIPIVLTTLVLASVFPWLYLKGLNAASILKDGGANNRGRFNIQKSLVTVQFVIAIVLIFNVLTISKQLHFMKNKNLGFNKENIVYVNVDNELNKRSEQKRMKEELLQNPNIVACSYRSSVPTVWSNGNPLSLEPEYKKMIAAEEIFIDKDYFDLMQIRFIAGENVYAEDPVLNNICIVNQQVVKKLGLEAPYIDKVIYQGENDPLTIKGVVENVNTKSLTQSVDPNIYLVPRNDRSDGIMMFKISNNYEKAIDAIQKYCMDVNPDMPFEYHFLDETYDKLYKSENNAKTIIIWLTILAIVITTLGLLAMILFITESRVKEIGIRRANGAKISEVMLMLNLEFIKWVVIAFVIACPIAWYAMNKWLDNFAYRTEISWWIFLLAGALALLNALITVNWLSWRTARRNPVEALRYE